MQAIDTFSFQTTLAASERVHWRVEDLIGGDKRLDFTRPFLPEAYARTAQLDFLTPAERLTVNQIRGHSYLHLFVLFEDFILPFVLDHTRHHVSQADDYQMRAMLQFAAEEAKHTHLFHRFAAAFRDGFGTDCATIGPASEMTRETLKHGKLAIALLVMQGEWMSQCHYTDSVRDDAGLDPCFKDLLRHHWMEEAQHAKLDTMMVLDLARQMTEAEVAAAFEEFLGMLHGLDEGLKMQAGFDLDSFLAHSGRTLSEDEKNRFLRIQHQAMRWTFLGSGMTHPQVTAAIRKISPKAVGRMAELVPMFS